MTAMLSQRMFKMSLFWKLQLVFWGAHCCIWFILDATIIATLRNVLFQIVNYPAPFLLSHGLRIIYKKYQVHRLSFVKITFIILILSGICGMFWIIEQEFLSYSFFGQLFEDNLLRQLFYQSYPFVAWSIIYIGYKFYKELVIQKQHTEQALLLAKSAQLEMLKYQLNPHFLFNTLSSLRGLIGSEPAKAKEMVTHISEFLRYSLLEGKKNDVPLYKEIEIIEQYLSIEKIRFNEDLIVEFDIAPETKEITIPIFLIHPLVENAIKHGMQTSPLPLMVWINTTLEDQVLLIEVKNTGKWVAKESKIMHGGTGTGMQNIKKRLEHAYPASYSFEIIKDTDLVLVHIKINMEKNHE
jgi:two-component system, LytTR family, sensor kinase